MSKVSMFFLLVLCLTIGTLNVAYGEEAEAEALEVPSYETIEYSYDYDDSNMQLMDFGQSDYPAAIAVSSMRYEKTEDFMIYEIGYESSKNLNLFVFSPPDGDLFFYRMEKGIVSGNHKIYIFVPLNDIEMTEEITFSFGDSQGFTYFAFCSTDEEEYVIDLSKILDVRTADSVRNVSFTEKIVFRVFEGKSGFSVHNLLRGRDGDDYIYQMDYTSDALRSMSFFNPPDGELLMIRGDEVIEAGENTLYFGVNEDKFDGVEEITMGFFLGEERTFIYYHEDSIHELDGYEEVIQVDEAKVTDLDFDVDYKMIKRLNLGKSDTTLIRGAQSGDNYILRMDYRTDGANNLIITGSGEDDKLFFTLSDGAELSGGLGSVYYSIPNGLMEKIESISFEFSGEDEESDFVYINAKAYEIRELAVSEISGLTFKDDLNYITSSNLDEFEFNSFKRAVDGDKYIFELNYVSNENRGFAFFDPPNNEVMMYTTEEGIYSGEHTYYFEVPARLLDQVDDITMGFNDNEDKRPYLGIDLHSGHFSIEMLEQNGLPEIDFSNAIIFDGLVENGFNVNSLYGVKHEGYYYFMMDYTSEIQAQMRIFDKDDEEQTYGETGFIMNPGSYVKYFRIEESKLKFTEDLRIKFWENYVSIADNPDPNYVDFSMDELSKAVRNHQVKLHVEETQNFLVATWNNNGNPVGVIGYNLYRWEDDDKEKMIRMSDSMLTSNKYFDSGVDNNKTYHYICKAVYSDGTESVASNEEVVHVTVTNNKFSYDGSQNQLLLQIGNDNFYNNGKKLGIDEQSNAKPFIKNNRTMVPVRAIVESIGGEIGWNPETWKVTVNHKGKEVGIFINQGTAQVDGENMVLENPPEIIDGRTYLPLRFVLESLDLEVNWDGDTQMIQIIYEK